MYWHIVSFFLVSLSAADGADDCWWTGCQPKTWGVRGCDQYGRTEAGKRPCKDGDEFNCCLSVASTTQKIVTQTDASCWWTGCQPLDWGVRGCDQYDRQEADKRACDGGHEFRCCPRAITTEAPNSCWWTGCQKNDWAVRGCQQYEKFEHGQRGCDNGLEYNCCDRPPKDNEIDEDEKEQCWWSACVEKKPFDCPSGFLQRESQDCGDGEYSYECCGKAPKVIREDKTMLTGQSYEDFVKSLFLQHDDNNLQPDNLRCDMVDPGKKHVLKVKNDGIRICDMCPFLPQKHLANVYLDRVPMNTQNNLHFDECFGLCYEDKTCMAVSYDQDSSTCYVFDSTAGGYQSDQGWITILMTQPSGIVRDWSYTRHTRLLGRLMDSSKQPSFLHCLNNCDQKQGCNYASYLTTTSNCSLFANDQDLVYVDLVYGHLAGVRVSPATSTLTTDERFILEGDDLSLKKVSKTDDKCNSLKNSTHGAHFSQACLVTGASMVGCDQTTGCKLCYYPERTEEFEKLSICPESEFERLNALKTTILAKMQNCLDDKNCVGVGYNSNTEEISTIGIRDFVQRQYTTRYMLKIPPNDSRKYLQHYDLIARADIKPISSSKTDFEEMKGKNFQQCIDTFNKNQFTRMSYSLTSRVCKFGTEKTAFIVTGKDEFLSVFKRPSLLSPALNYLRTPGFGIVSGKPRATTENCVRNCEEECSKQCSKQHGEWCVYVSLQQKPNSARCQFYDDDSDFRFQAEETSVILTQISSLDFSLQSFDKLDAFQSSDIYNCFTRQNTQTQTSLTVYQQKNKEVSHFRGRRGIKDFFKNLGKSVVDGFKKVGKAIVDTGKGVVNTVKNVVKGDFKAAGESFMKIPVVDMAKNTVELGGAVITGDWDKAKKKGKEILESDAFELVTTVALPGAGKLITSGAKAGIKTIAQAGKKGASAVNKGGKSKIDDAAKDSRKVKNEPKAKPKDEGKKKDEKIEKERGEKCDNKKRTKRATGSQKPGNCKTNQNQPKCDKPTKITYVIGKTLEECNNRKQGDKCRYECKPGYNEEKTTAVCSKVGNNAAWQPKPKCVLEDCPAGNNPLIVVKTPQAEAFGNAAFGDYITAYVALFDKRRKLPIWSIALHQSGQFASKNYNSAKTVKRSQGFTEYPCKELKNNQAKNGDYNGHGKNWHKGHLTPANVARWSEKAKRVSNLYINAAPQDAYTNSGPWNLLEAHVYCFSKRYRTVVATGICSDSLPQKVGSLPIPKCYWKMACYRDEQSNHQVVGFYSGNTPAKTDKEEEQRKKEIFEPLSQDELLQKISGGFNDVWVKPVRSLTTGRPIPVGSAVWFPVNTLSCRDKGQLSDDEKNAWKDAFKGSMNELKRGKNAKDEDDDDDSDSDSDRRRRKRDTKLSRGCHGSEIKSALDESGFFIPYSEEDDVSDSEDEDSDNKDEGDGLAKVSVQSCGKRIVGYYTSWGEKTIAGLELQRLTHVIYAFLEMHSDGKISIGSADRKNAEDVDKETKKARKRLEDLMNSAKRYSHLKVMFAVGGWENSQYFSAVAASPGMRVTFIAAVIRMIEEWGFDGVDIDWEYPVTGGADEGVPADKQNYVVLMKELRTALDALADRVGRKEKFLISFAGAAGQWTLDPGYDLPGLFKYTDFVNIMTYDYFGAWASKWGAYTGPPSPLYFGMPPGFSGKTNTDWSVKYYTCKTQQPHKINMGVPFYGRYWENVGASVDGKDEMWRTASSVNGKFVGGYVPWYKVKSDYVNNGAFQKKFHEKAKTPYAWNPSQKIFLGYEDKQSLEHKVKYAVDKNVGGLMIWALELDDDDLTLLNTVAKAPLCQKTDPKDVNHKCSPIDDKRWWTPEDGDDKAGLCGRSAPLYKGFYPVCDPDDPGYSCCGAAGYCGFGPKYCDCPTCKNYREDPKTILKEPIKPSIPVTWYLLNDPDGKRGRCGRKIPKIGSVYPTCNPDDDNSYCCSNGGYCGNTDAHCKCDGCINFKKDPKYQFGPKKWWTLEDGKDLGGQCGPKAPKVDGKYEAECEPTSKFHCCSPTGWCGSGPDFCDCKGCKNFKK